MHIKMKTILSTLLLISFFGYAQQPGTLLNPATINGYTTNGKILVTATSGTITGVPTWTPLASVIQSTTGLLPQTNSITINGVSKPYGPTTPSYTIDLQNVTNIGSITTNTITVYNAPVICGGTNGRSLFLSNNNITLYNALSNPILDIDQSSGITMFGGYGSLINFNVSAVSAISFTGTSMTYNGNQVATTNQLPIVTGGTGVTVSGTTPNYTISATGTSSTTILTGSTNVSVTGSAPNYTISSTTPTLTGAGIAVVSGSYPNYTVTATQTATPTQTITLTGDATGTGTASIATTLATVNSNVGTFGNTASSLSVTVNGKGLITAVGSNSIQIAESQVTNLTTDLAAKSPSANPTFSGTVTLGQDATTGLQAVTYQQFQLGILGRNDKEAAKYTTTAALPTVIYANGSSGVGATLTGASVGAVSIDGSSPSLNDRVLVKNQISTFQNGLYTVTTTGSGIVAFVLTRTSDFNQTSEILTGATIYVTSGSTLGNTTWVLNSSGNPIMGTNPITFVQTTGAGSYLAGSNINITGTTISVSNAPTFTTATLVGTTTQSLTNYTGAQNLAKGADIASSSTVSIANATGNLIHITGTTPIDNFGTGQAGTIRNIVFDGALTINSSTATILCPDNTSITTAANDQMQVILDGSGLWRVINFRTYSNVWQTWSPSYTGFSANPTGVTARYFVVGKMCTLYYACTAGTSSLTTTTITFPFTSANTGTQYFNIPLEQDNGSNVSGGGMGRIGANTNTASLFKGTLGAWTASGNKSFQFTFTYEIQ